MIELSRDNAVFCNEIEHCTYVTRQTLNCKLLLVIHGSFISHYLHNINIERKV